MKLLNSTPVISEFRSSKTGFCEKE